ncbi:MAG: C-GCAxxG-C-C family protein [Anaerolineales bacterium]|nr:C-GCAxxG-C-C family protein [Anaerolineales bacterium]
MDATERADELFKRGYNCAQAVFAALAPEIGISEEVALRIAAAFGGGMGRLGEVCGAVSGAFMLIGYQYGNAVADDAANKQRVYQLVRQQAEGFQARHGSILCRELLGCNISEEAGMALARQRDLFHTRCPAFVRASTELVGALLDRR